MPEVDHKIVKKRNKPTLSCLNCRKRKTKCDRQMPCSSCIHAKRANSCSYDLRWMNPASQRSNSEDNEINVQSNDIKKDENELSDELKSLKLKINNLESFIRHESVEPTSGNAHSFENPIQDQTYDTYLPFRNPIGPADETINFYAGYDSIFLKCPSRRIHFGPLSWVSILRKDPWLSLLWSFQITKVTPCYFSNSPDMFHIAKVALSSPEEVEEKGGHVSANSFKRMVLVNEGFADVVPFKSMKENNLNQLLTSNYSNITMTRSLFEGRFTTEMDLVEKITKIMPSRKLTWSLIDRFFEKLYIFMPLVDESFKDELSKIVGPVSYDDVPIEKLKIEKKLDLALIAIALIIMRMTFLFHFSNRNVVNEHIMNSDDPGVDKISKYILNNPINLVAIEVAEQCVDCFEYARKTNILVFQAVLFMRLYHVYAPEHGDLIDGGDSEVSSAVLIQMANSLGLNRDPDTFFTPSGDEKLNHLGRKIWHFVIRLEKINIYGAGNVLTINPNNYDTKLPFLKKGNSNTSNIEHEKAIVDTFAWLAKNLNSYEKITALILNVNEPARINGLIQIMDEIEYIAHRDLFVLGNPNIESASTDPYTSKYYEVAKTRLFLAVKCSLVVLYFHLFLHYEATKPDYASFYLKKLYYVICNELSPYIFEILRGRYAEFALILNPDLQMVFQRTNQVNFACYLRARFAQHTMELQADHSQLLDIDIDYKNKYDLYCALTDSTGRAMSVFVTVLERISSRYYCAWRMSKAHRYITNFIQGEGFFKLKPPQNLKPLSYTPKHISEIRDYAASAASRVESVLSYEDSVEKHPKFNYVKIHLPNQKFDPNINVYPYGSNEDIDQVWLRMMAMKKGPIIPNQSNLDNTSTVNLETGQENGTFENVGIFDNLEDEETFYYGDLISNALSKDFGDLSSFL
ncbi:uncharacterized protein PRCAT00005313001 [Priceomyces carsonii]|uniref:uncharacterized protein n=1 Tax=Priceomyces carsonii TaxID=28549 RepID=UPI002EDA9FD4|nr:unnamed protein product [Priceomyces carsonii]